MIEIESQIGLVTIYCDMPDCSISEIFGKYIGYISLQRISIKIRQHGWMIKKDKHLCMICRENHAGKNQ